MNKNKNNLVLAMGALIALAVICGSAKADVDYVLMLQNTPADGGTVSPEPGVHSIKANGDVTLIARPRPGYEFVTWLGDVADASSNSTKVSVNAPKIVVAVFQRSEYELPFAQPAAPDSIGGGGGGLVAHREYTGGTFGISPAGGRGDYNYSPNYIYNPPPEKPTDNSGDPPAVPGGDGTQAPEPATMLLIGLGSILVVRGRNK